MLCYVNVNVNYQQQCIHAPKINILCLSCNTMSLMKRLDHLSTQNN